MFGFLALLGATFLFLSAAGSLPEQQSWRSSQRTLRAIPRESGSVWPKPQQLEYGATNLSLTPSGLRFVTTCQCDVVQKGLSRYRKLIFPPVPPVAESAADDDSASFNALNIFVNGPCEQYPYFGMDEKYSLSVSENGTGTLHAASVWGAVRGLETFSQLVFSPSVGTYRIRTATVEDWPRFFWRGILLDTSRHFIPVKGLLETLELMGQNKFNVFHWHLVDQPSFPYQSKIFPALSDKGAYSPRHVYSQADIVQILDYARLRGVRVVAEFDTPGHTTSWGLGQPGLLTRCFDSKGRQVDDAGVLDVSKERTWDFLLAFFSEVLTVFPDRYLHLGGDEVAAWAVNCWQNNPDIQKYMRHHNFTKWQQIESLYFKKFVPLLQKTRSDVEFVVWNEVLDHEDPMPVDKTIVQVWNGPKDMDHFTGRGYRAILSQPWYLNYINYGADWDKFYVNDPQDFNGTEAQKRLVMGGEACVWGEFVDGTNLVSRTWPRASAVAERLWSSRTETKDPKQAAGRLQEHTCRMILRGYPAEPPNGPSFCPVEWIP